MHTCTLSYPGRRNNNSTILKNVRWRETTILVCHRSRTEHLWSFRAESWELRQHESRCGNLIPDPHKYKRDLRRRWQGLQFSNRSLPIRGAPETLVKTLMSLQSVFYLHHGCHPTKGRKFFLGQFEFPIVADPLRYEMQPSPTVLRRKGGKRGIREADCIPADYPSQVRSGYTAFGHSDSIQANKSQVIIMRMRIRHLRPATILLRFKLFSLFEGLRRGIL